MRVAGQPGFIGCPAGQHGPPGSLILGQPRAAGRHDRSRCLEWFPPKGITSAGGAGGLPHSLSFRPGSLARFEFRWISVPLDRRFSSGGDSAELSRRMSARPAAGARPRRKRCPPARLTTTLQPGHSGVTHDVEGARADPEAGARRLGGPGLRSAVRGRHRDDDAVPAGIPAHDPRPEPADGRRGRGLDRGREPGRQRTGRGGVGSPRAAGHAGCGAGRRWRGGDAAGGRAQHVAGVCRGGGVRAWGCLWPGPPRTSC
jgi:hypothetical protein